MKSYNYYTNIIKKLANKEKNYDWNNGNGFLGRDGIRKKKLRPDGLDREISRENLLILKSVFEKHNLFFWLIDGTLLGAVREKNFIKNDNDTDIRIHYHDIPLLVRCVPELEEKGLKLLRISDGEISFMRKNEYIDIEFLREKTRFTEKFDKIEFLDTTFNIPNSIDEYLTLCYGNWIIFEKII